MQREHADPSALPHTVGARVAPLAPSARDCSDTAATTTQAVATQPTEPTAAFALAMRRLREHLPSAGATLPPLEMASRLLGNVLSAPSELKYRRVKPSNPKLHAALFVHAGGRELMLAIGFRDEDTLLAAAAAAADSGAPGAGGGGATTAGGREMVLPSTVDVALLRRHHAALDAAIQVARCAEADDASRAAQQRTNEALQAAHAERAAREEQAAAEREAAEQETAARLRRDEDERRKAVAREKREKRKQKREAPSGHAPADASTQDGDIDEIDAALAALGKSEGSAAQGGGAQPTLRGDGSGASALPWGRDREQERERERLKAALHKRIASGDSHKRAQPSKEKANSKK